MPIFEYKCKECGKKFEELVAGGDTKVPCPECGSTNTSRLLSVFASSNASSSGGAPSCATGRCGGGFS